MKSGSHPAPIRTNRALAHVLGVSEAAVRKARREGRLSDPGSDGWDVAVARREWATNTLPHVGGRRQTKITKRGTDPARGHARTPLSADAVATGEGEARRLLGVRDGTVLSFQDARRARELVKLAREALDLRLMTEDTFSKAELDRYVFRVWRGVRDRLDAAVSREAPLGAAHFQIDEGTFWRWLRGFMRRCQEGLSDLGVAKIAGDADEDDAEVQP